MRQVLLSAFLLVFTAYFAVAQGQGRSPRLLLTAQRLKRLKRERERQTPRWMAFEERVKSVPDSPERGFELSLYYAISGDAARASEAVLWAKAHPCDLRQVALINDVVDDQVPFGSNCPATSTGPIAHLRDELFLHTGDNSEREPNLDPFLSALKATNLENAAELYAAAEYVTALRSAQRIDVRQSAVQLFNSLPVEFLLTLTPAQVDRPDWQTHIAALALIGLDPNSDGAQFLQGWAIEDRQMVHEGPGVAYELLWADPYLPGVGYQNLDPWWYNEEKARLLARTDWALNACSIKVTPAGVESSHCPEGWQSRRMDFGRLTLIPMVEPCLQAPQRANNASLVLWKLRPGSRLKVTEDKRVSTQQVDRAGMWRVASNIVGKICSVK